MISMIWPDMYSINMSLFTESLSKNVLRYSERRERKPAVDAMLLGCL